MIQDFTLEEIKWRYNMLNDEIDDNINLNAIKLQQDENTYSLKQLICGSLIYLHKIGAINIILHKKSKTNNFLFTTTRLQCTKTSWIEPEPMSSYSDERPSNRAIPIPNLFNEDGNKQYTHISLTFSFPNTNIGYFCERMIQYLRQGCKKDVNVINAVIFMQKYFTPQTYIHCMPKVLGYPFIYDHFHSLNQTPSEVEDLMSMILEEDVYNLYDPFMRTGSNMCFTMDKYHAQATDRYHFYATMLGAGVLGLDTKEIEFGNCLTSWDPRDCDTIIASPELNMQIVDENEDAEPITTWALEKVYKSMDRKGRRGLLLLPASVLTSLGKVEQLRHDITESNLLDTIVLLPANLFPKTNISTTLILLKSNRSKNDPITFADFSSLYYEFNDEMDGGKPILDIESIGEIIEKRDENFIRIVSVNEIRNNEYEWYVPKFIKKQDEIPAGSGRFKIKEILHEYDTTNDTPGFTNSILRESKMSSSPFDDYKPLKITILNKGIKDETDYLYFMQSCFVIDFDNSIKTYYYEQTGKGFMETISVPNIYHCYHIDTNMVHVGYLRLILHNVYRELQQNYSSAKISDLIPLLMNTEILIPLAIEEQESRYQQAKLNTAIEKARKEGLDEIINSMKQEYIMEVRMRKHDMKPFLSQLDSQAKLISFYMDKIEGNESIVTAIKQKLYGISNAVSKLRLHLNRLTEEDIYGTPELINPLDVLNDLTGDFRNYSVKIEVDTIALSEAGIKEPQIYISRVDLSTLSTTIIENAVTHAFSEKGKDFKVLISLTYDKEKSTYIIDFTNNGLPMPLGMDKFRYGLKGEKGAKSTGSGIGGYRVKSITRHFGGDYDVLCKNKIDNLTTIRLLFPKYNTNE